MNRLSLSALFCLLHAGASAGDLEPNGRARIGSPTESAPPPENAAPLYWQAFSALPEEPKTEDETERQRWLAAAEPALNLLRTASGKRHCDWDLDYDKGLELELPHLMKSPVIARAALARAKRSLSAKTKEGTDDAAADIAAVLRFSRHVSTDLMLASQHWRGRMEKQALELVLDSEADWNPAQASLLLAAVEASRPCPGLADCLERERTSFTGWFRRMLDLEGAERFKEKLSTLNVNTDDNSYIFWKARGKNGLHRLIDSTDADYREAIRIARLPEAEYGAARDAWLAKLSEERDVRVISRLLIPTMRDSREKLAEADARLEKARATLKTQAGAGTK